MKEEDYIPTTPQERILAATIDILEREDITQMTSRGIASAAGVNIAAINYYFRSKEALLEAALSSSLNHGLEHMLSFIEVEPWDPRQALHELGVFLLEGSFSHPVVTRKIFFDGNVNPRRQSGSALADIAKKFASKVEKVFPRMDQALLLYRIGAFITATLFPALIPDSQPWLDTEEKRSAYIEALVDDFLARCQSPA